MPTSGHKYTDIGKIILKVISDQIKIIFSKNDFKSDQDHIFKKNDLDLKSRSKIIFCSQSPLFEGKNFKKDKDRIWTFEITYICTKTIFTWVPYSEENSNICYESQAT
jgi:hypothetical protein